MRSLFRSLQQKNADVAKPVFIKGLVAPLYNESLRIQILTGITIFLHLLGLIGLCVFNDAFFSDLRPIHVSVILSFFLIAYWRQWSGFLLWAVITFILTFGAEFVGVHTGLLFGNYSYQPQLGINFLQVPILICLSWIIVICGAISLARQFTRNFWGVNVLASLFAVIYDWSLEPVAQQLNYWHWYSGEPPLWNYVCWALVTFILSTIWQSFKLRSTLFPAVFFIIQIIYFLLLIRWA